MSKINCPECGEPIAEGQRVCDNCHYELTDAELGIQSQQKTHTPTPTSTPKQSAPTNITMPDNIMAHGNVEVTSNHAEDKSVHDNHSITTHNVDNSQTVNNTHQTVNNNTTILIMGGQTPLPENIDPQTAAQIRQAQASISQPARQDNKPIAEQQNTQQTNKKGIGAIGVDIPVNAPVRRKSNSATIIVIIIALLICGGGCWWFFSKKSEPQTTTVETTISQPTTNTTDKTATAKPKKTTTKTNTTTETVSQTESEPTAGPKIKPSAKPADPHYDSGMKAFEEGNGLEAIKEFKASGSKQSLMMLGKIYENGCGTIEANAMMAHKYYKQAENL